MAKYIDADKQKEKFKNDITQFSRGGKTLAAICEFLIKVIDDTPAADVVEVKHGKWIDLGRSYYTVISQCSECSAKYDFRSPYCPNCGAKMYGDRNA